MREDWKGFQKANRRSRRARGGRRSRLAAVAVGGCLAVAALLVGRAAPWGQEPEPRSGPPEVLSAAATCRDVLCEVDWPTFRPGPSGRYEQVVGGHRVVYTLDRELQEEALGVLRQYKVPYGAFVAVEPTTGRVLALAEHSAEEPSLTDFSRRATYPAASLIKVITAAAALEAGVAGPASKIRYEGDRYRLNARKVSPGNARREGNVTTLTEALGESNNVAFGKLGLQLGAPKLEQALHSFGFNRSLAFDFALAESRAEVPRETYELARTAAGFGDVYLSPIHAALLAAAVGNRGTMMQPYVVEEIRDEGGKVLYQAAPAPLGRSLPEGVARQVASMMTNTVTSGTSSKVFHRYARRLRSEVGVAGKTGSLTGSTPPGRYEWFIGFAPVDSPRIAVASLVVNRELWHIKGTFVAQSVMREFFGM